MEQENTVVTNAIDESQVLETPQADAGAQVDEVSMSELFSEEPTGETVVQEQATPEPQQQDAAAQEEPQQSAEQNRVYASMRRDAQRQAQKAMENDPVYQFGLSLVRQRAQMDNISAEDALYRLREDIVSRQASELAQNPEALARMMLEQQLPAYTPQQQPQPQPQQGRAEVANAIAGQIIACREAGELPSDFDLNTYAREYPNFLQDCAENGVRSALLRIANAPKQPKAAALPQSMRPTNDAQPGAVDVFKMTSKQFAEYEKKIDQALAEGRRVLF